MRDDDRCTIGPFRLFWSEQYQGRQEAFADCSLSEESGKVCFLCGLCAREARRILGEGGSAVSIFTQNVLGTKWVRIMLGKEPFLALALVLGVRERLERDGKPPAGMREPVEKVTRQ